MPPSCTPRRWNRRTDSRLDTLVCTDRCRASVRRDALLDRDSVFEQLSARKTKSLVASHSVPRPERGRNSRVSFATDIERHRPSSFATVRATNAHVACAENTIPTAAVLRAASTVSRVRRLRTSTRCRSRKVFRGHMTPRSDNAQRSGFDAHAEAPPARHPRDRNETARRGRKVMNNRGSSDVQRVILQRLQPARYAEPSPVIRRAAPQRNSHSFRNFLRATQENPPLQYGTARARFRRC